jgi:hypothetical protein
MKKGVGLLLQLGRFALAHTCIVHRNSSGDSSTQSSSVGVSLPATTNSRPIASPWQIGSYLHLAARL